jgi:hypothetical protein
MDNHHHRVQINLNYNYQHPISAVYLAQKENIKIIPQANTDLSSAPLQAKQKFQPKMLMYNRVPICWPNRHIRVSKLLGQQINVTKAQKLLHHLATLPLPLPT